ncbi:MAG: DEAD/DEAH box helicase family protein [Candidimonas sp.]|nr:DEAD/DEAH box helicase family protein [Candidimonas sp.]
MLTLKKYQNDVLAALTDFMWRTRTSSITHAWQDAMQAQGRAGEPYHEIFERLPCVCLRVPTGGGKTLLAAHAVAQVGRALMDSDSPVVLWLTPSDTIRSQTLEALSDVRHPYRQALTHYFGDRIRIADLESLQTVGTNDVGNACIIVVTTIQSLNVSDTSKRNVYAFFEELQEHFRDLPSNLAAGLEKVTGSDVGSQPYLTEKDVGRVKWSVANWIHLHRPLVIVDEAHNNRTDRFFKTIGRLNPAGIVEMTATPVAGNNVLYHVSAQELRAEEMIKLPIVLAEHPEGWRECLRDAILTRDRLELVAQKETDYVRPIALIQAMPRGGEATVDIVKQHLLEQENIPVEQIAVATGSQKELDGIDLFDPSCPIRYVVTIEALKEGWDCSFAYVLASLQSVNSAKDVEQLLGRVLRMPYARNRSHEALNKAYAHIVATNFAEAASNLRDRLVQNMGFERLDTASLIIPQYSLGLPDGTGTNPATLRDASPQDLYIDLPTVPDTTHWPDELKQLVDIRTTSQGATLVLKGHIDSDALKQAEAFATASVPMRSKQKVVDQFAEQRAMRQAMRAPAELGASFVPIPQLCLELEGHWEVVENDTLAQLGDWCLLDNSIQLANFSVQETVNSFEINVNGEKVSYRLIDTAQLKLNDVGSHVSEQDLVRWLDAQVRQPDIAQPALQAYLVKLLTHLLHERGFALTALVRARFQLSGAVRAEIQRLRKAAMRTGFQGRLMDMSVPAPNCAALYSFRFEQGKYPARNPYRGGFEFSKHFYPTIHDLREKTATGAISEEFRCAQAIEAHQHVKWWVRNIERQQSTSFWLPTSSDYFYPDFMAELTDGRVLAVEYKGEPYKTNDDSREKIQVGSQWEKSSNGQCLFLFAVAKDEAGRDVFQQLDAKLAERPRRRP